MAENDSLMFRFEQKYEKETSETLSLFLCVCVPARVWLKVDKNNMVSKKHPLLPPSVSLTARSRRCLHRRRRRLLPLHTFVLLFFPEPHFIQRSQTSDSSITITLLPPSSSHPQLNDSVRNKEHLSYLLPPLGCLCPHRRLTLTCTYTCRENFTDKQQQQLHRRAAM